MAEAGKKSSCGCCFLKVLAVFVVLALMVAGVVGYYSYQTVKWVEMVEEAKPQTYPALAISAGEEEDVDRLIQRISTAKTDNSVIDETVSPAVFNGVIEKIVQGEKEKGKQPDFETFRVGIEGEHFTVLATKKVTSKTGEQKFVNVQVVFDCEVEEGHFNKLSTEKVIAGGQEAPMAVKAFISFMVEAFKKGVNDNSSPEASKFKGFKLLKKEGERVHVILDPSKFEASKPAIAPTPPDAPKPDSDADPKKDSF